MEKLPFNLQLPFFNVFLAKGDLSALEIWIYQQKNLEKYLSESDYFELISFGLTATMVLQDEEQGFNFSTEELAEIQIQANLLYTAIDTGKIILLESPMITDNEQYQDLRNDEERASMEILKS